MSKSQKSDKKQHDDYLLQSNRMINSQQNQPLSKRSYRKKYSQFFSSVGTNREKSNTNKYSSVYKVTNKSLINHKKKSKMILNYDLYTVKTNKTDQTLDKKQKRCSENNGTSTKTKKNDNMANRKHKKNKSKLKLDYMNNRRPLKISKSGRFDYDSPQNKCQPFQNFTQNTNYANQTVEDQKQTETYLYSSINCGSLENIYTHCVTVMSSYKKKIDDLSSENYKLKQQNRKLKESRKNK